ncbi:IS3 family transposase [Priestia aryabhattai]|uniref:IS3 family transposase n=1 Tax=Priestia aryabhattai TaxID=412384 RepID=UPI00399C4CFA
MTKETQPIHLKSKAHYGASKIHKILVNNGCYLSLKLFHRLTNRAGIHSIMKKKYCLYSSKKVV